MKILHYGLGFPPFRRGGMTKYCIDLMREQTIAGHQVGLVWPGKILNTKTFCKVKTRKTVDIGKVRVSSFEIINPLPVPLLDGIQNVELFTQARDEAIFLKFFKEFEYTVLHIHTLMGLPKEFITAAKKSGVCVVFTSHDYFGLCPNCSFMNGNTICNEGASCKNCSHCNRTALSYNKMVLLQSGIYRTVKQLPAVKWLRRKHITKIRSSYKNEESENSIAPSPEGEIKKYIRLRAFYISMLQECNVIHFNSNGTKELYTQYMNVDILGKVISISNAEIQDRRELREKNEGQGGIRIGYLGPPSTRKGFIELLKCTDKLYELNKNFTLVIYCGQIDKPYAECHEPYKYSELSTVMKSIDVLVVPSMWRETFGFTVLEALSYGVPVIVSDMVGAKDLIQNDLSGVIYHTSDELVSVLSGMAENKTVIKDMNRFIHKNTTIKTMSDHATEIEELYKAYL